MEASKPRKRAKHTRSRQGCRVCRIRRVRCDETRPACLKCTSTGRICEGFPIPQSNPLPAKTIMQRIQPKPPYSPSLVPSTADTPEERSFAYFCANTASEFAAPYGSDFWTRLVLQLSTEPCVRHAVIALGALHEAFIQDQASLPSAHASSLVSERAPPKQNGGWNLHVLAAKAYTQALRELSVFIKPAVYDDLHVSLLCCILCICFEFLRGFYDGASTHMRAGFLILRQWSDTQSLPSPISSPGKLLIKPNRRRGPSYTSPTGHLIRRQIVPIFVRLAIQARAFTTQIVSQPLLSSDVLPSTQDAEARLRNARTELDVLCSEIYLRKSSYTQLHGDELLVPSANLSLAAHLERWRARYSTYLVPTSPPAPGASAPPTENLALTLWYTVLTILQKTSQATSPMVHDACISYYEDLLYLSDLVIKNSCVARSRPGSRCTKPRSGPRFRVDMEMVPILYLLASKCRHPIIRRKAISLLRSGAWREGCWDGHAIARLAEEIVRIEEEATEPVTDESDVPATQRVWKLDEDTDLVTRTMKVRFMKWGELDYGPFRVLAW